MMQHSQASPEATTVKVRFTLGPSTDLRRIQLAPVATYSCFVGVLRSMWPELEAKRPVITYIDDEGDACSITDDEELAVALRGHHVAHGGDLLRLAIVCPAPAPARGSP